MPARVLLTLALALAACSSPEVKRKAVGGFCERDLDCDAGLVCKAARCGPKRSLVGGACVTDQGCAEGLGCISGRCSAGVASDEECQAACANLAELFTQAARDANKGGDPAVALALSRSFEEDCTAGCAGKTLEEARCLARLASLELIDSCR